MKIYTRVVVDSATNEIEQAEFFDYDGPLALCDPVTAITAASAAMTLIGSQQAAAGARRAGQSAQTEANFEAAQLDQQAGQQTAASQRAAAEETRRAALLVSHGLAVAGASGGGASDPTVVKLLADITGEGAYRAGVDLYQGEEKARQMRLGAAGKRLSGEIALQGGEDKARAITTTGIGNSLSLFGKYGMGGFKSDTTATGAKTGWELDV